MYVVRFVIYDLSNFVWRVGSMPRRNIKTRSSWFGLQEYLKMPRAKFKDAKFKIWRGRISKIQNGYAMGSTPRYLGTVLGGLGWSLAVLGRSWTGLGATEIQSDSRSSLSLCSGVPRRVLLGTSWGGLGLSWGGLGRSRVVFGSLGEVLGRSWGDRSSE